MGMALSIHEHVVIRKEFFCVYSRGVGVGHTVHYLPHTFVARLVPQSLWSKKSQGRRRVRDRKRRVRGMY